jgi:hypothetical protein
VLGICGGRGGGVDVFVGRGWNGDRPRHGANVHVEDVGHADAGIADGAVVCIVINVGRVGVGVEGGEETGGVVRRSRSGGRGGGV